MNKEIWSKLKGVLRFCYPRQKSGRAIFLFIAILFFVGIVSVFYSADIVSAQATGAAPAVAGAGVKVAEWTAEYVGGLIAPIILWVARLFLSMAMFFLTFVIEIGAYNDYINSPAVQVGWVIVRDITNMFFVAILLLIAFGTILGLEQYEWRRLLVKFVMAAVLVNFSRIICGVIIDAGQIVMTTFVNGVAAAAGGNLIQAFNAGEIFSMATGVDPTKIVKQEIFMASILSVTFAGALMAIMAVYVFILLARMIMLWILIVLSPLAFVLSVIPQTQNFANQWWKEFGNNVISGPIVAFFLWLSLATLGAGNINDHISKNNPQYNVDSRTVTGSSEALNASQTGIGKIGSWAKMANFFIAFAMLAIGVKITQQLGVAGGSAMGKALDFGKKVATIASGYAAGRYAYEKGIKPIGEAVGKKVELAATRPFRAIKAGAARKLGQLEELQARGAADLRKEGQTVKELKEKEKAGTITAEEKTELTKLTSVGKRFWRGVKGAGAMVVEPQGAAEKRQEYRVLAAKMQKEIAEEEYSQSSSVLGAESLTLGQKLADLKELSERKKARKFAEENYRQNQRAQISDLEDDKEKEEAKGAAKDPVKIAQLENQIQKKKSDYDRDFAGKYGKFGEITSEDKKRAAVLKESVEAQAKLENMQKVVKRQKEIQLFEERDKRSHGATNYADEARARHLKEDMALAEVGDLDDTKERMKYMTERILDPNTGKDIKDAFIKQLQDLELANYQRGSIYGEIGEAVIHEAAGIRQHDVGADETPDNVLKRQANFFQAKLLRTVDATPQAVRAAFEELRDTRGEQYLRQATVGLNSMSETGAINSGGIFKPEKDTTTGETKTRLVDITDTKDQKYLHDKRDWAESRVKNGGVGMDLDSVNGNTMAVSAAALNRLSNTFAGLNVNRVNTIDKNAINMLADAYKNAANDTDRNNITNAIRAQTNDAAVIMLLKRIDKSIHDSDPNSTIMLSGPLPPKPAPPGGGPPPGGAP